jgi:recombination protein RecA
VIKKAGAFYSYGETRLGQGRDNSREFLKQNPELLAEIETAVRAAVK